MCEKVRRTRVLVFGILESGMKLEDVMLNSALHDSIRPGPDPAIKKQAEEIDEAWARLAAAIERQPGPGFIFIPSRCGLLKGEEGPADD